MNALYSLYDALLSINVPPERARAVVDAMERDMSTILATKTDLAAAKADLAATREFLEQKIDNCQALLEHKIELLRSSMTVRLGSMQVVAAGLLFAALKLT